MDKLQKNEILDFDTLTEKEKTLQKMKFCIISCHKSQMSKARLTLFALEKRV